MALAFALALLAPGCGGDSSSSPAPPPPLPPAIDGSFAPAGSTPTMNQARDCATATLLPSGKVLIAGGVYLLPESSMAFRFIPLNTVELYDPATNTFAPAASLPTMNAARSCATATLLLDGQVLIAGGYGGNLFVGETNPLASVELYDPRSNTFTSTDSLPDMNAARAAAAAALMPGGEVLIAGGSGCSPFFPSLAGVDLYDPTTNSFAAPASTPHMNKARQDATATLLNNGKVLIAGGMGALCYSLVSVDLYDPATNSFAAPASTSHMNNARQDATATLLNNGKVLIAGGLSADQSLASVDLYDPSTNSFVPAISTPTMNQARFSAAATLLNNGKVLIAGGLSADQSLASVDLYDPATNSFVPAASTPAMNQARSGATATLLPNGKVLIAGGLGSFLRTETPVLNSVELYTP